MEKSEKQYTILKIKNIKKLELISNYIDIVLKIGKYNTYKINKLFSTYFLNLYNGDNKLEAII
jgi:hypothetical protein